MQNIKNKLERIHVFDINPNISGLSQSEQRALKKCVEACQIIHEIFFNQVDLKSEERQEYVLTQSEELQLYYQINGGPWDEFDNSKPFLPNVGEKPLGAGFYPLDMTKEEWEKHLQKYPEQRASFESPYTVIERDTEGGLMSVPYHKKWRNELSKASQLLKEAAEEVTGSFREYLVSRAEALLNDNYQESDIKWLHTSGYPFEVIIGPIEFYEDRLFGLKTSYQGFVGIPNKKATEELEQFKKHLGEFNSYVSKKIGIDSKKKINSMVVVEDIFRAGFGIAVLRFVAFNLPNDKEIHKKYGSKNVFSATLMKRKFDLLSFPVAQQILSPADLKNFDFRSRFLFILGHEFAHGMGPGFIEKDGKKRSIEQVLKDLYLPIEEAKADCLSMVFLSFLKEKKVVSGEDIKNAALSQISSAFDRWKVNFSKAHSIGGFIEYNWLKNDEAIYYNNKTKLFSIDTEKVVVSYTKLAFELMRLQKEGNYQQVKDFCKKWTTKPAELLETLNRLENLPVDTYPIFKVF